MILSLSKISTAKVSSFVSMANVNVQPVSNTIASAAAKTVAINNTSVANAPASVSLAQQKLPIDYLLKVESPASKISVSDIALKIPAGILKPAKSIGISDLISKVIDQSIILPSPSKFTSIIPVRMLNLDAGRQFDPRVTQEFVATTAKFKPYESLTGISQERPEIVMLTNFQPLFNQDVSHNAPHFINAFEDTGQSQFMTDAGRYIDAQYNMRSLKSWNMQQKVKSLKQQYPYVDSLLDANRDEFTKAVQKLKGHTNFLLNMVRVLETQKRQLDLRHDIYRIKPTEAVQQYVQNSSQAVSTTTSSDPAKVLKMLVQTDQKQTYDPSDALIDMGFNADQVKNVFSSTKIWTQLLVELKASLKYHSLKFLDIPNNYYANDRSATVINQPSSARFDVSEDLPDLPNLTDLVKLRTSKISSTVGMLKPAFSSIYQNVFFKNEEARIAALATLLSREFRYSAGLADEQLLTVLRDFYGFSPSDSANQSMFDSIIGRFGNNITDLPAAGDSSLASVAQRQVGQVGVLTFESKYIEGDTGTLTPGGEFYFDRILEDTNGDKFDTTGIDQLADTLRLHGGKFSMLIDTLNLLSIPANAAHRSVGSGKFYNEKFLNNASDFMYEIANQLINPRTGTPQSYVANDRLGAVYSQARRDNKIKAILFLFTLCKVSRAYGSTIPGLTSDSNADNTATSDELIKQLIKALEPSVQQSRSIVQLVTQSSKDKNLNTASMTVDSIAHALKNGTQITRMIELFMATVIKQFRNKSAAINNGYTRYSGYLDTIVMMMAFDFVIAMIARYSNQQLVGVHRGLNKFSEGQVTFAVAQTTTNHLTSFSELSQRITGEQSRIRQMVLTVNNTLNNLGGSLAGISNYLNSKDTVNKLKELSVAVSNDPTVLKMLLNEQQIMLLASTADSLTTAYNNFQYLDNKGTYYETSTDAVSKNNQELAILDESEIPPAMREALYGYFGTGDFASTRGSNKRILTVGVPLGFAERIKQKINTKNLKRQSFQNKQSDILYVSIYKVDIVNSDIVYKPVRYLFELSRFPTRFTTSHWLPLKHNPTITDIVNSIPTQCYDAVPGSGTANSISSGIEYASTAIANNAGVKGSRAAFTDSSYSFLSSKQKAEILHNHVVSQLLEVYIKLMTGINVAEHTFYLDDMPKHVEDELAKTLAEHSVAQVTDKVKKSTATQTKPTSGVLFSNTSSGIAKQVSKLVSSPNTTSKASQSTTPAKTLIQQNQGIVSLAKDINNFTHLDAPVIVSQMQIIANLSNILTSISTTNALNHKVLSPKDFDRVFNVIIDARDFEIDVAKTIETPHGRQALDLLIKNGDVVPASSSQLAGSSWIDKNMQILASENPLEGRLFANVAGFKFRDRDKNQGDLVTDKYFVTIESFDEEEL